MGQMTDQCPNYSHKHPVAVLGPQGPNCQQYLNTLGDQPTRGDGYSQSCFLSSQCVLSTRLWVLGQDICGTGKERATLWNLGS